MPMTIFAVAIAAPVLPAETKPSANPSATSRAPMRSELFFLRRTEVATGSSMPITSAASMNSMPWSPCLRQPQRRNSGSTRSGWPTSMMPTLRSRAAASAPSISGCGARSLPIASTTTLPVSWRACFILVRVQLKVSRESTWKALCFRPHANHFAAFVVAALRAHAMRHARLLTVRAGHGLRGAQRVMRAAFAGTRFRVSSFGIRHNDSVG